MGRVETFSPVPTSSELSTTVDQWRASIVAETAPKYPDGQTAYAIAHILGLPQSTVHDRLDALVRSGKCQVYKDYRKGRLVTVYILEK
jgi:predicted ArsR family transcriptional regulator